jgi:putative oxidoreductase
MTYALWIVQVLLAALFLFLGGMKLTTPLDQLAAMMGLPGALILFVGISELLGAFGLVLPGVLKYKTGLTPLAAAGLVVITLGATVLHIVQGDGAMALFPLVVAGLAAFVAYGRTKLAPLPDRSGQRTLASAR